VNLPAWVNNGQPSAPLVVGGVRHHNHGASQITNGRTNGSSNLRAARNLLYESDQSPLRGKHRFSSGGGYNKTTVHRGSSRINTGQVPSAACSIFAGNVSIHLRSRVIRRCLAFVRSAFYVEDVIQSSRPLEMRVGFRGESTNGWTKRRTRVELCV